MKFNLLLLPLGVFLFLACFPLSVSTPASSPPPPRTPIATQPVTLPISQGIISELRVPVSGPPAALAVWVQEPKAGTLIRGTVVFIHGFGTDHTSVANAAAAIRRAGYRSVLVDMRGFGESTGTHADFGVTDASDMKQLVDFLQKRGWCGPTVGVYGTSLGAATAILWAATDPRITSVVAVAPFADIRSEVPNFARGVLGSLAEMVADDDLNKAADLVGKAAKWNLDNARPIDAIKKTKAEILLIHGDADTYIPHKASEELHAAAMDHTMLLTPHNRGHVELCFDIPGELQGVTRDWFNKTLMPQ